MCMLWTSLEILAKQQIYDCWVVNGTGLNWVMFQNPCLFEVAYRTEHFKTFHNPPQQTYTMRHVAHAPRKRYRKKDIENRLHIFQRSGSVR